MDRDVKIIVGSPSSSAASDTTRTGTSNDADFSISQPYERSTTSVAITPMGSALHRNHSMTSRANTPGTANRGSQPPGGGAHDGTQGALRQQHPSARGGRSTQQHAERIGSSRAAPSLRLSSIKMPPDTPQAVNRIARLAAGEFHRFFPLSRSSVRGRRHTSAAWEQGSAHRPPRQPTMPTTTSSTTGTVFFSAKSMFAGSDVWPRSGIRMAAASAAAMR